MDGPQVWLVVLIFLLGLPNSKISFCCVFQVSKNFKTAQETLPLQQKFKAFVKLTRQ
jgi:hypothetical protein